MWGTAIHFVIGESTLRFRLKRSQDKPLGKAGRKCVFDEETEKELAELFVIVGLVHPWKNFGKLIKIIYFVVKNT